MNPCEPCKSRRHDLCAALPGEGFLSLAAMDACPCREATPELHRELARTRKVLR